MKEPQLFASAVALLCLSQIALASPKPIKPTGADGQPLNFGFEDGTLKDWDAVGSAFENQPVRGDAVNARIKDVKSGHHGNYWIGTYEKEGDTPQGILTSVPFEATYPFATFLIGGGSHPETRVELITADDHKVFFKTSAFNGETMRTVVVDLKAVQGKKIFIRIIDEHSGGWGHINFDDFVFYDQKPTVANEFEPIETDVKKGLAQKIPTTAIRDYYEKLGGTNCYFLRYLVGSEMTARDGIGRFCRFSGAGSIYWTPKYGAWSIHGRVRDKWLSMEAEAGVLGYPVTDETDSPDGLGRYNHFQTLAQDRPQASIYWTPKYSAWSIMGPVRAKWMSLGAEASVLGYPVTDGKITADGIGRYNLFKNPHLKDQEGAIYFTELTGAFELHGPILEKWRSLGAEGSVLGYPMSDQFSVGDGSDRVRNRFQNGTITFDPATGLATVP